MGNHKKLMILIAEDDFVSQKMIEFLFNQLNENFDLAKNGLEAYEMVQKKQYDFIFMDMNMPIMDGLESISKIRDFEEKNSLKKAAVFVLSAEETHEVEAQIQQIRIDGIITKPLTEEKMRRILYNFI
jgi:CheY-like chemotaxis protein